jgi:hypothetical protein
MAVLRQLKPAGVFEGYFTFGLGLSYRTTYRFWVLHNPDRLVLDLNRHRTSAAWRKCGGVVRLSFGDTASQITA